MTADEFDQTLRSLTQKRPFRPFVVELNDGTEIAVSHPQIAFGDGGAVFLDPTTEGFVDFECSEIRAFRIPDNQAPEIGMNKEQFEDTLRTFLRQEPFVPFVIERNDGTPIEIAHPGVAFNDGGGFYFSPTYDLIEFDCTTVRDIRLTSTEAAP